MCTITKECQILDSALRHLYEMTRLDFLCSEEELGGGLEDLPAHLATLNHLEVLDLSQCTNSPQCGVAGPEDLFTLESSKTGFILQQKDGQLLLKPAKQAPIFSA